MNRLRLMRLREVPKTTSYSFKHINHYQKRSADECRPVHCLIF